MTRFCNHRYLDNDELLRHLRMHHCSCRICDQVNEEEKNYQFYAWVELLGHEFLFVESNFIDSDKNSLLEHQRDNHHPCEHPGCMDLDQIPVFKNDIDLQVRIFLMTYLKTCSHSRRLYWVSIYCWDEFITPLLMVCFWLCHLNSCTVEMKYPYPSIYLSITESMM